MQNLGCSYVVIDKDGADYTFGDAFKKDRKKKGLKYGYGALREYYGPWLKELQPGSSVEIPCKDFDIRTSRQVLRAKPLTSGATAAT
jgi:hypothetical protein